MDKYRCNKCGAEIALPAGTFPTTLERYDEDWGFYIWHRERPFCPYGWHGEMETWITHQKTPITITDEGMEDIPWYLDRFDRNFRWDEEEDE